MCISHKLLLSEAYYRLHPEVYTGRAKRQAEDRIACPERVLKAYGLKSAYCGESDPRFLTIDHMDGGGSKERKRRGDEMYKYNI